MKCSTCGYELEPPKDDTFDENLQVIRKPDGSISRLSEHQWDVLYLLRSREGRVVPANFIYNSLYGVYGYQPGPQIIAVWMTHIRRKLVGTGYEVRNLRGRGYVLGKTGLVGNG
jgi:DNA-binding response OmpR family regulator